MGPLRRIDLHLSRVMHNLGFFLKDKKHKTNKIQNTVTTTSLSCSSGSTCEVDQHSAHCGVSLSPLFAGGMCLHLNAKELRQQNFDTERVCF